MAVQESFPKKVTLELISKGCVRVIKTKEKELVFPGEQKSRCSGLKEKEGDSGTARNPV